MFQNKCRQCNRWFESYRPDAFLCSKRCQSQSQRDRDKERVRRTKELLAQFTATVEAGADIVVLESLARAAREIGIKPDLARRAAPNNLLQETPAA
jgi:hypothetical protein